MPPQVHQLTSKLLSKIFTKLLCLSKMALKTSLAVLLSLNLLFFATLSSSSAAPTPQPSSCRIDIFKLGFCAAMRESMSCCSHLEHLVDLEAAVCVCAAIRADVLGHNLNVTAALHRVLNGCGKSVPSGFHCA